MDIADDVAAARADAAEMFTDTCKVTRADSSNPGSWSPTAGPTAGAVTVVYTGSCRVRSPQASGRDALVGDYAWTLQDRILQLDFDAAGVRVGDTVTVTASPQGVGLGGPSTIVAALSGSHMSARRFVIREAV